MPLKEKKFMETIKPFKMTTQCVKINHQKFDEADFFSERRISWLSLVTIKLQSPSIIFLTADASEDRGEDLSCARVFFQIWSMQKSYTELKAILAKELTPNFSLAHTMPVIGGP